VRESGLTPDIPLGPFEGTPITAYAATGKTARLHARRDCSYLRTNQVHELVMPLDAATIERMCGDCARWGTWTRPGTALGIFLRAFFGYGLTQELNSYTEPDPDEDVTEQELADAAALLRPREQSRGDDDEDETKWEAVRAARDLRDTRVIPDWCAAAESLFGAAAVVARYPWLRPWASERLDRKIRHAEALRRQAAQLVDTDALIAAAAAGRMPQPELPASDPAFAVLGGRSEVRSALLSLWYRWHADVIHGWRMPHEYSFLGYELDERLGNKRKGRDRLRARAREILRDWVDGVLAEAARHKKEPDRLVFANIPAEKLPDGRRKRVAEELTRWELGVLAVFTVAADWPTRTLLVRVPPLIAERMLTGRLSLTCAECPVDPADEAAYKGLLEVRAGDRLEEAGYGALLPGTLDDTPVSDRRPVTQAEVQALREALDDHRQLFIVCSVSDGVEVLPLARIEERCRDGWTGVLLAEADDLPLSLIERWLGEVKAIGDADDSKVLEPGWEPQSSPSGNAGFGEQFGTVAGVRELRRLLSWHNDDRELDRNLRVLALVRGIHDLRQVGDDYDPRNNDVPWAVWHALLATDHLDLRPFLPPDPDSPWDGGLGLPLGVLGDVQIYTTSADPMIAGKGHSPFCQHAGDRGGITRDYFLLTLADLLRRPELDWCSKCGGYALRRLTDTQIAYYRAADRLRDIDQQLNLELAGRGRPEADLSVITADLDEIAQWIHDHDDDWQRGDTWRLQEVVRDLTGKAQRLGRYHQDGWPNSGSVVRLNPKR